MTYIELIQINPQGRPVRAVGKLDDIAQQVCTATAALYAAAGFVPPWVGYLAWRDDHVVGGCAFKSAPVDGKVEIGYFTFPDWEGQGIGTLMVRQLLDIAHTAQPQLTVIAQTGNEEGASSAILRKLGFTFARAFEHIDDGEIWEWQWVGGAQALESPDV